MSKMGKFASLLYLLQIWDSRIKNFLITEVLFTWPERFLFDFKTRRLKFDMKKHVFSELDDFENDWFSW